MSTVNIKNMKVGVKLQSVKKSWYLYFIYINKNAHSSAAGIEGMNIEAYSDINQFTNKSYINFSKIFLEKYENIIKVIINPLLKYNYHIFYIYLALPPYIFDIYHNQNI